MCGSPRDLTLNKFGSKRRFFRDIKQLVVSVIETVIKIAIGVFIVMFVFDAAVKAYDYGYRVFAEEPMTYGDGRTISISVTTEDSVKDVGENLEEKGLIRDANLFLIQVILSECYGKINPGIYDLNTSMKTNEMIEILTEEKEEETEEKASSDNVPIGAVGGGDTEGTQGTEEPSEADGRDGTENPEGDAGAEDPGEDGGEGNVQPDAAGE